MRLRVAFAWEGHAQGATLPIAVSNIPPRRFSKRKDSQMTVVIPAELQLVVLAHLFDMCIDLQENFRFGRKQIIMILVEYKHHRRRIYARALPESDVTF
jgi:hypothetical protein